MTTLVVASVLVRDLWLLGVGAIGMLITVPIVIDRFFEGELAAPLALLGAGVLLIGLGLMTARRKLQPATDDRAYTVSPPIAIAVAVVAVAAVTPVVLTLGR